MDSYLMTVIKKASVFLILAQAVVHFRPNPSYEKYFKFLAGVMTVVILLIPVVEVFRGGIGQEYEACLAGFADSMDEISKQELSVDRVPSQTYLQEMGKEIKEKLNDFVIIEGYRAESAEISGILAEDGKQEQDECRIRVCFVPADTKVARIEVGQIQLQEASADEQEEIDDRERMAQKWIAELLGVEEDRVEVEICE